MDMLAVDAADHSEFHGVDFDFSQLSVTDLMAAIDGDMEKRPPETQQQSVQPQQKTQQQKSQQSTQHTKQRQPPPKPPRRFSKPPQKPPRRKSIPTPSSSPTKSAGEGMKSGKTSLYEKAHHVKSQLKSMDVNIIVESHPGTVEGDKTEEQGVSINDLHRSEEFSRNEISTFNEDSDDNFLSDHGEVSDDEHEQSYQDYDVDRESALLSDMHSEDYEESEDGDEDTSRDDECMSLNEVTNAAVEDAEDGHSEPDFMEDEIRVAEMVYPYESPNEANTSSSTRERYPRQRSGSIDKGRRVVSSSAKAIARLKTVSRLAKAGSSSVMSSPGTGYEK